MRTTIRSKTRGFAVLASVAILTVGLMPLGASAADHRDAPSVINYPPGDINDVYVYSTDDGASTVLVMTTNPGAGVLPRSLETFGPGVGYEINVDTDGNLLPDETFLFRFAAPSGGSQAYEVFHDGNVIGEGDTGADVDLGDHGMAHAGLFDDPFFFDLAAFQGAVLGSGNGRSFCDGDEVNFFDGLNTTAIVIEVPNDELGGDEHAIGVWASTWVTRGGKPVQLDEMGRPAINTVFSKGKFQKELFNRVQPAEQRSLGYRGRVARVLRVLGGYSAADSAAISGILIPDVNTYTTGDTAGFLNGRRLADDVIDAELALVTDGGISTDCIANDSTFSDTFPYLGTSN